MKAYHVTERANWETIQREGILARDEQADPDEWKWDEAPVGHDTYWVSLFREDELEEARWFAEGFVEDPIIIEVDLPDPEEAAGWGLRYGKNAEGYFSVAHEIPVEYIVGRVGRKQR